MPSLSSVVTTALVTASCPPIKMTCLAPVVARAPAAFAVSDVGEVSTIGRLPPVRQYDNVLAAMASWNSVPLAMMTVGTAAEVVGAELSPAVVLYIPVPLLAFTPTYAVTNAFDATFVEGIRLSMACAVPSAVCP